MKLTILLLLTWVTTSLNLNNLDEPIIKVTRTFTDAQIKQTEQQVLQRYGVKVEVKVLERNNKGEITNLKCVRYDQAGKQDSSCSSDNFGLLVITREGCKIATLGHEDQI
ncbi:hypothetical protein [Spirosoma koreense]